MAVLRQLLDESNEITKNRIFCQMEKGEFVNNIVFVSLCRHSFGLSHNLSFQSFFAFQSFFLLKLAGAIVFFQRLDTWSFMKVTIG